MKRELLNNTKIIPALTPTITALEEGVTNGLVLDRLGFLSSVIFLAVGNASGTPSAQSVKIKLQHGDESDGSDMEDFNDKDGNVIQSDELLNDAEYTFVDADIEGAKRYIRIVVTVDFTGGTTPAIPVNSSVALGDAKYSKDVTI